VPPKPRTLELRFPSLGVTRRQVHERVFSAVSYGSPWSINCRLEDPLDARLRGGSFTGISAGSRPSKTYRDRTLRISTANTNVIECSAKGDSTDYFFGRDISNTARATRFQLAGDDGTGPDIVGFATYADEDRYLICWSASETWVLAGDPTTGTLRQVSKQVGMIAEDAWCEANGVIYFLSSRGLYRVGADGSGLAAVSEDKVPEELISVSDDDCTLTYQHSDRGVYIHLTTDPDWFYDTERDGFWPFDTDTTNSHVLIGPLRLGGPDTYGMIQQIHGIMAIGSADVKWQVVKGNTAEQACDNGKAAITAALAGTAYAQYVSAEGTWGEGRSYTSWPRVRGMWCCLWLESAGSWAFESVHMTVSPSGRWRG